MTTYYPGTRVRLLGPPDHPVHPFPPGSTHTVREWHGPDHIRVEADTPVLLQGRDGQAYAYAWHWVSSCDIERIEEER